MQASELSQDERLFLIETTDFERSFRELSVFIHERHPNSGLPEKLALAQALADNLMSKGVLQCVLIRYAEPEPGRLEIVGTDTLALGSVRAAWSNPSFWQQGPEYDGATYVGVMHQGPSKVALVPTEQGEFLLDEILGVLAPNHSLQARRP